ncbi:MAG: hypothetical protein JGK24_04265 [Microcoleus sp. PH2017_29_MFU_D_A]|nr:hypothetical protein [Microcoleus sp. PH2017_03_ELD_O_A]MCC3506173.1 hypothetical protein [Microcoleus sp. PH2017_19_SFW_U_A]MCC3523162.1 hypothetical protein [Microcoleus sp. PH2017_20_SFW_D_A]MCC3553753.1 hypothetical protein [Microcoleus sp. PH2017_35_SFW_U_B]MCC3602457.1 hypothetical protein [Microcoleus sp. PH2017_29_MFU_D_A]MCC3633610.1 hypothetical protein [Microcoleus sp. PH2017_37_MFU_D_B]TAG92949.1 MAG: hypothetical protein EAZ19_17080 [Oscillatoriales cyanobacterium]
MKIIKYTATELIIQTKSILDFWFPSCLLMTFGLIGLTFDYHAATLSCQRSHEKQGNCQLVRSHLLGSNIQEIQLAALQGAKVERFGSKSRVVLVTNVGDVPFSANSTNWGNKDAAASDINFYLKNAKSRLLRLSQDDRWLGWTGGIFLLAGVGVIALGNKETYSFDGTSNTLTVKRRGLLARKVIKRSLFEIYGVEVDRTKDRDHDVWYQVRLLVSGGDRISLPHTMNPYKQVEIAKAINNYLHARSHESICSDDCSQSENSAD